MPIVDKSPSLSVSEVVPSHITPLSLSPTALSPQASIRGHSSSVNHKVNQRFLHKLLSTLQPDSQAHKFKFTRVHTPPHQHKTVQSVIPAELMGMENSESIQGDDYVVDISIITGKWWPESLNPGIYVVKENCTAGSYITQYKIHTTNSPHTHRKIQTTGC